MARERTISTGRCYLCGGVFAKAAMTTHLKSCRKKAGGSESAPADRRKAFHLVVEGRYAPEYWMHLEVDTGAALETLDRFLRNIWLECCDHMSEFRIDGDRYSFAPFGLGSDTPDVRLRDVLAPGMKFEHAYDFGSTTYLRLKVVAEVESPVRQDEIGMLAQNEPPAIPCDECGKPATQVCRQCMYSGKGWLCEECAARHECDEWMLLPVVNSPRVGVCGYAG
ncbi:MAG: plasmid pRiA4b ORF-3 family protein [Planctomycetes bacterium]|nr:plasmid pRiA4b ORF-3 family protein [Planctomycetota bacterium]